MSLFTTAEWYAHLAILIVLLVIRVYLLILTVLGIFVVAAIDQAHLFSFTDVDFVEDGGRLLVLFHP